jgi:kynurenine formamidase
VLATPTTAELDALFESLKTWGRWGSDDERGALNWLRPEHAARAAALARAGVSLSLARDLPVAPAPDNPFPAHHHMLAAGDARGSNGIPGYEASRDYVGTDVHGLAVTHVDALSHMFVRGAMYNGFSAAEVLSTGARRGSVMALADGLVARGVLLDVPRALGASACEPGAEIGPAQLEQCERAQSVRVGEGDALIVATGREARRASAGGALNPFTQGLAGLHPACLPWLAERRVAALGSDGISDPMPGLGIPQWPFPIHQVGITALGLLLLDNLALARALAECAARGRWEFLLALAPLRIPGGTGCPVNPLAIF